MALRRGACPPKRNPGMFAFSAKAYTHLSAIGSGRVSGPVLQCITHRPPLWAFRQDFPLDPPPATAHPVFRPPGDALAGHTDHAATRHQRECLAGIIRMNVATLRTNAHSVKSFGSRMVQPLYLSAGNLQHHFLKSSQNDGGILMIALPANKATNATIDHGTIRPTIRFLFRHLPSFQQSSSH